MKRVMQQHETGCVPASIAMVAGISYAAAVRVVHPRRQKGDPYGATEAKLLRALKRLDIKTRLRFCKLTTVKNPAIVIIDWHPVLECHAVVWTGSKILDPYPAKWRKIKRAYPTKVYAKHTVGIFEII